MIVILDDRPKLIKFILKLFCVKYKDANVSLRRVGSKYKHKKGVFFYV